MKWGRLPTYLTALGLFLLAVFVLEIIAIYTTLGSFDAIYVVFGVSLIPFYGIIIGGGVMLRRVSISTDRYPRIAGWVLGAIAFFGGLFLIVGVLTMPTEEMIGAVRWGVTVGAGLGVLIGGFEARGIESARRAERRRIHEETLERRNVRLEELSRIVSHDLQNPLTVAKGRLAMVDEDVEHEHIETVQRSLDRMEVILTDMLELARNGQLITDPENLDLQAAAREAWSNVPTGDATLLIEESTAITGDPERMAHVFENLFRNAIEHGGEEVTVRIGLLGDDQGFFVEDDGPGIPESERENVFKPGSSSKVDGTGFGLTITRSIVEAHDWSIAVTAGREGGARFDIRTADSTVSERDTTASAAPVHTASG